jgi:GNAT superfamily N-acetyltransferase
VHGHVAEVDGEVAATALWFTNLSTWDGVTGVCVADLYVRIRFRRGRLARALLSALARECLDHGYTRLSLAVLDWNSDAIALYEAIGAGPTGVAQLPGLWSGVGGVGRTALITGRPP